MKNLRYIAYDTLIDIEENGAYSNISLNSHLSEVKEGAGFVRELVYGVLKNKMLLDYYLAALIPKGLRGLKLRELTLLRMGIYQIAFMNSVPDYAAINESVNMAKELTHGKERFINGDLRSFTRTYKDMPEPKDLKIKYSLCDQVFEILKNGYPGRLEEILIASNETPELSIRVNLTKTSVDILSKDLEKRGFTVKTSRFSERSLLVRGEGLINTPEFKKGCFSVQDEASIIACDKALDYVPENSDFLVIDTCAAPGGKSAAIAEKINNRGKVLACDIYGKKLNVILNMAKRLGLTNIETICHDATSPMSDYIGRADLVLCDVPCSGLGVLRRKPEIKYRTVSEEAYAKLYQTQSKILESASSYVKPGGVLLYSTCTLNPKENEEQVSMFIKNHGEFTVEYQKTLLPCDGTDGFHITKMRKDN